ncbi:MAG: UDP-N-acetylmuramoyl-L-alanyl-D-glutamate--2,6-diaminopimelate ligase [Candidatus Yanofskybacteria bacterium]|nr:UDP-N-acetylmuramoyl-L-alanyl-D-glutamate--2,6-diaminopimelate ligase [Candidatus Yanofskybacteria bacterium]
MFKENKILEKLLDFGRKSMPRSLFKAGQPIYHWGLAWLGALLYGFPSHSMKVIGVTGTKGKSTTVFLIAKIFEKAGIPIAMIGSLGYKIKEKEWPNTLKMTMPGRFKVQQFLYRAKKAGCKYVVLEVTSEGIKQKRHLGIKFDAAVLTNIHREHIENHGTFENYIKAKERLFKKTKRTHILNEDEPLLERFKKFKSNKKILYGWHDWEKLGLTTQLNGDFNKYNILAAVAVAENYGVSLEVIKKALTEVNSIPGRMEYVNAGQSFQVVVDYAHTPDSLEMVYQTLKRSLPLGGRLICVLGAAGGGRDKWKRPEFGRIAAKYCDEIILTDEDPYDENPEEILNQISSGFSQILNSKSQILKILDRKEAIKKALTLAKEGDIVVITGKGSETSMAVSGGQKIPWSDKKVIEELLK